MRQSGANGETEVLHVGVDSLHTPEGSAVLSRCDQASTDSRNLMTACTKN
jgi:hypothetical protein